MILLWMSLAVAAESNPPSAADSASVTGDLNTVVEQTKSAHGNFRKKGARGKMPREKHGQNTEGTEAPNRFEADPVIKSRYESGGRSLEVDPD